jgi:hypothetical protein
VDEDGNTIVLTAEQLQSYQEQAEAEHAQQQEHEMMGEEGDDAETQSIVHELLEGDQIDGGEEVLGIETHTIIDEHGNHQLVSGANLQDLITLHSVDADGNIVTSSHGGDEEQELVDGLEEHHVSILLDR